MHASGIAIGHSNATSGTVYVAIGQNPEATTMSLHKSVAQMTINCSLMILVVFNMSARLDRIQYKCNKWSCYHIYGFSSTESVY